MLRALIIGLLGWQVPPALVESERRGDSLLAVTQDFGIGSFHSKRFFLGLVRLSTSQQTED
jgi:hypothetical protein